MPHFKSHHFFGLSEEDVIFFTQGVFPCLDQQGRIIMRSRTNVPSSSPLFPRSPSIPTVLEASSRLFSTRGTKSTAFRCASGCKTGMWSFFT